MTSAEALALFDDAATPVLGRQQFYIAGARRDGGGAAGAGGAAAREQAGGIIVHKPTVAVLLPSDMSPLARRRPDFAGLRHVLVRFGFMLDRLPPRHAYVWATLTITLDHPDAAVIAQRPSLLTTDSESADSTTTDLSASLDGLARLSAQRTKVTQVTRSTRLPLITAENRGSAGFGWHFQAQEGVPLLPQEVQFTRSVIELPREVNVLAGAISSKALISAPRYGVFTKSEATPLTPAVPFTVPLGAALPG